MQVGDGRVYLGLDRVPATNNWVDKFGEVKVNHLVDPTLDHCALFISDPKALKQPRA